LTKHFGDRKAIDVLRRQLCPYTSSFRLDELDVQFKDGSQMRLVLKDLSRDAMVEDARRVRPEFLYEPRREINAYRWVLPYAPQGTAAWYGAVTDGAAGRYWLFLEQVDGYQLTQVGNFGTWERTAAWIARFHCSFSPHWARQLAERSGALVYDEDFYWQWLRRAQRFANPNPEARGIIERIARQYAPVVKQLAGLQRTLIHGELYACNVLIGRQQDRERICPVDWEMSALGPGLIDLAALSAGWAEPKQQALARAYYSATHHGPHVDGDAYPPPEFLTALDCCRLHLAMRMLGWSDDWAPPREHAKDWLAEADRISRRLEGCS